MWEVESDPIEESSTPVWSQQKRRREVDPSKPKPKLKLKTKRGTKEKKKKKKMKKIEKNCFGSFVVRRESRIAS
jgi:hypothetical protein